ncbi:MAG TPA: hypothetical protein PKA00_16775 [Saprospiraceae bacterium]|nr:hypothetical protein [Saprospiraceae bacterium]HMQ84572.1 hypothetical protein [Saprospiraceae bacterium]
MFTINIYLRFALIVVGLIGGTILWATMGVWYGIWFVLLGLVMLAGYFLLGTIQSAAVLMQGNDFDGAEKRLDLTIAPKLLYATNKAYYYMIKGSIALAKKDVEAGEKWLKKAEEVKVPTDNERAMLQIQLASIAMQKGRWQQAQVYLRNAKQCKITEPLIKDQLKQLEKALASRGQINVARQSGMKGGGLTMGGKRRRPKMR